MVEMNVAILSEGLQNNAKTLKKVNLHDFRLVRMHRNASGHGYSPTSPSLANSTGQHRDLTKTWTQAGPLGPCFDPSVMVCSYDMEDTNADTSESWRSKELN